MKKLNTEYGIVNMENDNFYLVFLFSLFQL